MGSGAGCAGGVSGAGSGGGTGASAGGAWPSGGGASGGAGTSGVTGALGSAGILGSGTGSVMAGHIPGGRRAGSTTRALPPEGNTAAAGRADVSTGQRGAGGGQGAGRWETGGLSGGAARRPPGTWGRDRPGGNGGPPEACEARITPRRRDNQGEQDASRAGTPGASRAC